MELDTSWITNFEKLEKEYNIFYKDKVTQVTSFFIYINKDNDVIEVKREKIKNIVNNTINKNTLLYLIKNNNIHNNIKYKLISILDFNIDINTIDINNFLKEKTENVVSESNNISSYLNIVHNINDIKFKDTINIFQDINAIFFLYYNNTESNKIENNNQKSNNMTTKKVYINYKKHKKTKRK